MRASVAYLTTHPENTIDVVLLDPAKNSERFISWQEILSLKSDRTMQRGLEQAPRSASGDVIGFA